MRKDFYIFRHGETDYNLAGRWQGQSVDFELNDTGLKQAENLSKRMKSLGIEVIYSSPLKRAYQTAKAVACETGAIIHIMPELTEGSLGLCEGMYRSDVKEKYPDTWNEWYNDNIKWDVCWPEGETKREVKDRMFKAFDKMSKSEENIIGVASHAGAIRYFLMGLGYGPHKMPNTALFHVIYEDGNLIFDKLM
ncbi:MAG: histidine phosphatase family protein [Alphaproteobacteria bacterium]|nr:histidine phosphatase family protein [Alphaproteobacteria bacterium]